MLYFVGISEELISGESWLELRNSFKFSAFPSQSASWFLTAEDGSGRKVHFIKDVETSLQDDLPGKES